MGWVGWWWSGGWWGEWGVFVLDVVVFGGYCVIFVWLVGGVGLLLFLMWVRVVSICWLFDLFCLKFSFWKMDVMCFLMLVFERNSSVVIV